MKLIKYRDAGMHTYTYFWVSENNKVISSYFDTEEKAEQWMRSLEHIAEQIIEREK